MDLLKNLEQFSFITGKMINDELDKTGLDMSATNTLYIIKYSIEQGLVNNQINLANLLGIDRQSMVRLLNKLEQEDLVYRKKNPKNKRENLVFLTEKGEEKSIIYINIFKNIEDIVIKELGVDNFKLFNDLLIKMNSSLSSELEKV